MFHAYREAITKNRLHAELSSQAMALAPIVARRLAINDLQSTPFVLRAFSGLNYVTCVDLMRDGLWLASWPMPGCDDLKVMGGDEFVEVPLGNGPSLTFKVRVDEVHLYAPIWRETIIFAGCSMIMALIIFLALTFGFCKLVLTPLDGLKTAMLTSTPRNPVRAPLYKKDEIGDIVKAYNSLVAAARLFVRRLDKSQMRLADSEKRFRDLAEVSGDWFFEMDSSLKLTFISDNFYSIAVDFLGSFWTSLSYPKINVIYKSSL